MESARRIRHSNAPSIVVDREASYFLDPLGEIIPIHLSDTVKQGIIQRVEATVGELADLYAQFDRVFIERMDAGEAEALALLAAGKLSGHFFCTADGPAVQALALMGLSNRGISLESTLRSVGLGRKVRWPYNDSFLKLHIRKGQEMRIQGIGLAPNSRFRHQ